MPDRINYLPVSHATIDTRTPLRPLELFRHSFGHGGINPLPLPPKVQRGIARLQPRLVRIFLQEFFRIYPRHDVFDWSRLDPYMESLASTGAQIVAALCLKPPPLYPTVNAAQWRPSSVPEWQHVIRTLVHRYSVERPLVSHWEIGNEVDIGEDGGCPYLITDPKDYCEYYGMTLAPILETFPQAVVGGPANASAHNEPLPGLIRYCHETGTQLDFVSQHCYSDEPDLQASLVRDTQALLKVFSRPPEIMITEFSPLFESASTEDQAYEPRRAACVAATILKMRAAGLDWSFHYHLWDQVCRYDDFAPLFSPRGLANMLRHWNDIPHRFGLFGVSEDVRPQYFVYDFLHQLGEQEVAANTDHPDLALLAGQTTRAEPPRAQRAGPSPAPAANRTAILLTNYHPQQAVDRVVALHVQGLTRTAKQLTIYRIDSARRWSPETLQMAPLETRPIYALDPYECQVFMPAGCVALVVLEDIA